jgi:hypothetical protein
LLLEPHLPFRQTTLPESRLVQVSNPFLMCWSEYNKQIKSVQTKFNWGQININLVNQKVIKAKGG